MNRFTPGETEVTLNQKVVRWFVVDSDCKEKIPPMPDFGEVYLVKSYTRYTQGRGWFITLEGIGPADGSIELPERLFDAVMSTETLYSQIEDYL